MFNHFGFGRFDGEFRGMRGFGHGDERQGFGGRHWGGGRGFGRPFDHGELKLVILALIAEKPRHGYEIIKAIEEQFGGSYTPSPGVVYPTLTMLEELGFATVTEASGKKSYTVTEEGRAYLELNRDSADAAMGRMRERGAGAGNAPQLVRAVHNLKMALRMRQQSGPMTDEQLQKIVAAIDAAAVSIERS